MMKKRLEILIDDDEFLLLKEKAQEYKCSMGELVRESLREKYLIDRKGAGEEAFKKIASGEFALPEIIEWETIERFLQERYRDEIKDEIN